MPGYERLGRRIHQVGGIKVGMGSIVGSDIKLIRKVSGAADPASIAAGATGTVTVAVTGMAAGDMVIAEPPAALEAGLQLKSAIPGTNIVTLTLVNTTAGAIDGASRTWTFLWFDLT